MLLRFLGINDMLALYLSIRQNLTMLKRKRKRQTFTDQIRAAMAECGETRYRISKNTGLPESQLCRFASGEGLSMKNLDLVADYLNLEVVVRRGGR